MSTVLKPAFRVVYEGTDITTEINRFLIQLTYEDKQQDEPDEVTIQLENVEELWTNEWYPQKGDRLTVDIGYSGALVPCGTFEVDEVEATGPPDVFTIKALSAGITKKLRTAKSTAHENKTLRQIADTVAAANGLTIIDKTSRTSADIFAEIASLTSAASVLQAMINSDSYNQSVANISASTLLRVSQSLISKGYSSSGQIIINQVNVISAEITAASNGSSEAASKVRQDGQNLVNSIQALRAPLASQSGATTSGLDTIVFQRITQNREPDLAFLKRIASEYGYLFTVRDINLIFTSEKAIAQQAAVVNIDRTTLINYSIKDKTSETFSKAVVKYHNPKEQEIVEDEDDTSSIEGADNSTAADTLEIRTKAEDKSQAKAKAEAALYRANSKQRSGSVSMPGNPLLLAGNNFELTGIGFMSGVYNIERSTHSIDKGGGYLTSLTIKQVGFVAPAKRKTKPRKSNGQFTTVS